MAPGGAVDEGRDEADIASLFKMSAMENDEADCWATLAELIVFGW